MKIIYKVVLIVFVVSLLLTGLWWASEKDRLSSYGRANEINAEEANSCIERFYYDDMKAIRCFNRVVKNG